MREGLLSEEEREQAIPPLLLALPPDLLLQLLIELRTLSDIVRLRSCCRSLRQATSTVELWSALAQRRWADLHTSGEGAPRREVCTPAESAVVLPNSLSHVTSLVDVYARLVPMPSKMWPYTRNRAGADLSNSSIQDAEATICSNGLVSFTNPSMSPLCAIADCSLPRACTLPDVVSERGSASRDSGMLVQPVIQAPLPFAADAAGLGAPGRWALRLCGYFEVSICDHPNETDGLAIGLGLPDIFPPEGILLGQGPGSLALFTGSGVLRLCPPSGAAVQLSVLEPGVGVGDVIGCGIDGRRGIAFFTVNGKLLPQSEVVLPMQYAWYPMVAGIDGAVIVHLREGGCGRGDKYMYDLLQREEACWDIWSSDFAMRRLFEEQHNPSTLGSECERGWPWDPGGSIWERSVMEHCRPWLAQKLAKSRRRVVQPRPRCAAASDEGNWSKEAMPGFGRRLDLPALVMLAESKTSELDALAVTAQDVMDLAGFVAEAGLPAWIAPRLGSQGLRLPLFLTLPMECITDVMKRAGLSIGQSVRLKRAIRCKFGTPLDVGDHFSQRSGSSLQRRVFALPKLRSMVILLSPGLPCRVAPSLHAPIALWKRVGEVVTAVAECDGWVEIVEHSSVSTSRRARALWTLYDGNHVGQEGPLLRALPASIVGSSDLQRECSAAESALLLRNEEASTQLQHDNVASAMAETASTQLRTARQHWSPSLAPEGPRWSTLARTGQLIRERELQMLLELARLTDATTYLHALLACGASVPQLVEASLDEVHAIARRIGMPLGHRMRFANAVHAHLHRSIPTMPVDTA
mmetsp:Transcript_13462/g.40840  ORF Transcript_13462/g.40840 Transcript_13462/m.40840 type:complete len:806 (+) Transcript_13462:179-2596(+)